MKLNGELFNREDINKIHDATLEILSKKGIRMPLKKALDMFKEVGARVEDDIVYIEEDMLNQAISTVPNKFTMLARDPENNFEIGGGKTCFCLPNGPIFVKKGDEYWSSTSEDVINFIKLSEYSPTINMVSPWVTTAGDVPIKKQLHFQMAASLKYSSKPLMGLTDGYEDSKMSINLIRDFYDKSGEKDYVALGLVSPLSPLSYDEKMLEALIAYSEENQPIFFSSAVLPGATGPVTMAGTLALANAEILAGIVLTQIIKPGVPVIYGNTTTSTDLRFVTPAIGSPESSLVAIYTKGLATKYGMPCRSGGALSDSKKNDAQAGIESTIVMLPTVISELDFVLHGAGILDSWNVISYDKFIMDEVMTEMVIYLKEGVEVNEETLALDTIDKVVHGGQYLMENHTFKHMRDSLHNPKFFEKGYYDSWVDTGSKTAQDKILKAVDERLENYKEKPITEKQANLIEKYLEF